MTDFENTDSDIQELWRIIMGRRENRIRQRRERLARDPFERSKAPINIGLEPYMDGHTKVIPVLSEGDGTEAIHGLMTSQELMKIAHTLSDKEEPGRIFT